MGVPVPEMNPDMTAADEASAEAFVSALRTISAGERRKHASVYNYWLTIKRDRAFPPIHDLDPLEISDAGPFSLLLEMIGGGEDAEIRHLGHAIACGIKAEKVSDAPNPSLLSCIATRLPVVAGCRDAFAFEDEFEAPDGKTKCWVTLLPFSATGTWIDFVYGFVTLDGPGVEKAAEPTGELAEVLKLADSLLEADDQALEAQAPAEPEAEPIEAEHDPKPSAEETPKAGFSARFFEKLAGAGGFYGKSLEMDVNAFEVVAPEDSGEAAQPEELAEPEPEETIEPEPEEFAEAELEASAEPEPEEAVEAQPEDIFEPEAIEFDAPEADLETAPVAAEEPAEPTATQPAKPISTPEGTLQSKLTDVRAKADEARQAKLRANAALYEGLSAAYDFALDAEDSPEEYLKLVQAEGLKIQLRSPMRPVAKLAFDGMCDDMTIKQLEAVLAWAFEQELPRGTLADRIEAAGGIGPILSGEAKAA
jgi:hypothetical protein